MAAHPDYSQTSATKPRRRRRKETTISATAAAVASPDSSTKTKEPPSVDTAWCCAPPHHQHHHRRIPSNTNSCSAYPSPEAEPPKPTSESTMENSPRRPEAVGALRPSPGRMSPAAAADGYSKFNSALTAGLLNPMSPPPPPPSSAIRSSPTLFEMMSNEQPEIHPHIRRRHAEISSNATAQERHLLLQERVNEILASGGGSPNSGQFNDISTSDVKLTLSAKDGFSVCINVHRAVLAAQSKFFGAKLSERWSLQQKTAPPFLVEISDCDDVEIYLETIRLMYCGDLKRRLMKEDVSRVLEILKVSAAIVFESGILACLEYLEAAPWAEDEEEKVASLLSQLQLDSTTAAGDVLKRVSLESPASPEEDIVVRLLDVVLHGTDEKARREMKKLVSKMLRENSLHSSTANSCLDISKGSLYSACGACLDMLIHNFSKATPVGFTDKSNHDERVVVVGEIARQADNLNWVLDILIDRQLADDFTWIWASQVKLAEMHSRVPTMYRYEVSRLTARLCIGIGKGQILAPKEVRSLLLQTWLEPLYEDFGWMRRGCKSIDRNVMEEGLSQTILTLPLSQQQTILMNWFDRFLKCGDECPNIQRAFEVWWRRAFWRRNVETDRRRQQMQSVGVAAAYENGG